MSIISSAKRIIEDFRIFGYTEVGYKWGILFRVHWTLAVMSIVLMLGSVLLGFELFVFGVMIFFIVFIHELGHAYLVKKCNGRVIGINVHVLGGDCVYEINGSNLHQSIIAWGGVLAQSGLFVVGVVLWMVFDGVANGYLNVVIVSLVYFNAVIAIFNLAPGKGLDGYTAWAIFRHWRNESQ